MKYNGDNGGVSDCDDENEKDGGDLSLPAETPRTAWSRPGIGHCELRSCPTRELLKSLSAVCLHNGRTPRAVWSCFIISPASVWAWSILRSNASLWSNINNNIFTTICSWGKIKCFSRIDLLNQGVGTLLYSYIKKVKSVRSQLWSWAII